MKLRSILPVIVVVNFLVAGGLYVASEQYRPGADWAPPADANAMVLMAAAADAAANIQPPPHTTLDAIDPSTLALGCPPLAHEPWHEWQLEVPINFSSMTNWELFGSEPLMVYNGLYDQRGRRQPPRAYSILSVPRTGNQPVARKILPASFNWFRYVTKSAVYYSEQPAADGYDALVRLDPYSLKEIGRWPLPSFEVPAPNEKKGFYYINVLGDQPDGRLLVQLTRGSHVDHNSGIPGTVRSAFCFIDPQIASNDPPPIFAQIDTLGSIYYSWPTGDNKLFGIANGLDGPQRVLVDRTTGEVEFLTPTDPRFQGIAEMPPHLLQDQALSNYLQSIASPPAGYGGDWMQELEIQGTAAVRIGQPTANLPPDATHPTARFVAGAPKAVAMTPSGPRRFSLTPATRDLALYASPTMKQIPFQVFALNRELVLLTQIVPASTAAVDPALRQGCMRIGLLEPETGNETWIGTIGLPQGFAHSPEEAYWQAARVEDQLIFTWRSNSMGSSSRSYAPPTSDTTLHAWTRLPWPDAFPSDVPDGWLGTITPRPGTPIP